MLRNRRILLIENGPKKEYVKSINHNIRVVALTPMSRSLLEGEISLTSWLPYRREFVDRNRKYSMSGFS